MIPKNFTKFSGKENVIASINYFLIEQLGGGYIGQPPLPEDRDFFWAFDFPIAPVQMPGISTTEIGLFNAGELAFDRLLGFDGKDPIYGNRNQTLIEITCVDQDKEGYSSATKKVRNLRDRVVAALSSSRIPLVDCNKPERPVVGLIELDLSSNSINEKYVVDPSNQQVKRYVIVIRVFWTEYLQRTKSKTIASDAEVIE